jgi:hypothetical protein
VLPEGVEMSALPQGRWCLHCVYVCACARTLCHVVLYVDARSRFTRAEAQAWLAALPNMRITSLRTIATRLLPRVDRGAVRV